MKKSKQDIDWCSNYSGPKIKHPTKSQKWNDAYILNAYNAGLFEVESNGHIYSNLRGSRKRILGAKHYKGYYKYRLSAFGTCKGVFLHRIVALVFLGQPPKGETLVNHIDGNKVNNNPKNLEWVSNKENIAHAVSNGLRKNFSSTHASAKLDEKSVTKIMLSKKSNADLALKYGVSVSHIGRLKRGLLWCSLHKKLGLTASVPKVRGSRKLSKSDIKSIYLSKLSASKLAALHDVSKCTIDNIRSGYSSTAITSKARS